MVSVPSTIKHPKLTGKGEKKRKKKERQATTSNATSSFHYYDDNKKRTNYSRCFSKQKKQKEKERKERCLNFVSLTPFYLNQIARRTASDLYVVVVSATMQLSMILNNYIHFYFINTSTAEFWYDIKGSTSNSSTSSTISTSFQPSTLATEKPGFIPLIL